MATDDTDRTFAEIIREAGYRPRRRRTDVIVTGLMGFAIGAILGLGFLGAAAFLVWLAEAITGLIGWPLTMVAVALAGGIILAASGVREVMGPRR